MSQAVRQRMGVGFVVLAAVSGLMGCGGESAGGSRAQAGPESSGGGPVAPGGEGSEGLAEGAEGPEGQGGPTVSPGGDGGGGEADAGAAAPGDSGAESDAGTDAGGALPAEDAGAEETPPDGGGAGGESRGDAGTDAGAAAQDGAGAGTDGGAGAPDAGVLAGCDDVAAFVPQTENPATGYLCAIPPGFAPTTKEEATYVPCDTERRNLVTAAPPLPAEIVIVSWNVQYGKKSAEVLEAFKTHPVLSQASVVFLIEATRNDGESDPPGINIAQEIAAQQQMNYAFFTAWDRRLDPKQGGEHGNAVLSRFPMGEVTPIRHVPLNDWYDEDKRYGGRATLGATLRIGCRLLRVYASHFDTRGPNGSALTTANGEGRALQAAEARADANLPGRPRLQVIGGDFNTVACLASSQQICAPKLPGAKDPLLDDLLADGWQIAHLDDLGSTQLGEGFFPQRLDWMFWRGPGALADAKVERDIKAADHFPLWMKLSVPQGP